LRFCNICVQTHPLLCGPLSLGRVPSYPAAFLYSDKQTQQDLIKPELRLFLIMDLYFVCVATMAVVHEFIRLLHVASWMCVREYVLAVQYSSRETSKQTNKQCDIHKRLQLSDMKVSLMLFVLRIECRCWETCRFPTTCL
jgi:hypothetical protein